ncbi:hypothetical protein L249_4664 [Ophiocordyceps polyrhachis-furcata BCC 54312]|uniref:DUF8035 domain-containing protein n=1 Tax=Ophiocordyceps polyrhachis-furcata BCC 54312 TaxID=1330021 RepID=A0A367L2N5_9HYPO|nr:hypothetical protein L249_4664 [Ophiocordyceps polyrhachis-furcata BCC 54312]
MAHRNSRATDFEERDYYSAPRRQPPADLDERDYRPRAAPRSRVAQSEYDEVDIRLRDREMDRTPGFLRDDGRRPEAGPMVLRQREVETIDRHARSPSPVRRREMARRPKSISPPTMRGTEREHSHTRIVERERDRVRSPSVVRCRSPSPLPVRFVERRRRSPSPVSQHEHIRIVERDRQRIPSPSPSPSPPPPVIRAPTIEREVITHWTNIDHGKHRGPPTASDLTDLLEGVVRVKPPSPPPPPRSRPKERETDIDISLSKNRTEVDVHQSTSRPRSKSRERRSRYHDDELVVRRDGDRLRVEEYSGPRRRAHSAAPACSPAEEEAEYLTSKIDSRGRMGEAWGGATREWGIVDVPPGTERVRMEGVGGATTDTTWSRYSGVRRTQFNPERDGTLVPREPSPAPSRGDRGSAGVYDREREIDVDIDRRVTRTPQPPPPPAPPARDLWTEITKDLVVREAIEQLGYEYEETKVHFYIPDYLQYEDVVRLTNLSEDIRRARKERVREIQWERDEWERPFRRHMNDHYDHWRSREEWDDERVRERDVVYDSHRPNRGYLR